MTDLERIEDMHPELKFWGIVVNNTIMVVLLGLTYTLVFCKTILIGLKPHYMRLVISKNDSGTILPILG